MVPIAYPYRDRNNHVVSNRTLLNMSSNQIAVHLPDGAIREVPAGTTPLEIANSISPRLAAAAVVARLTPVATHANASNRKSGDGGSSEAATAEAAPAEAAPAEAAPAEAAPAE